MTLPVPGDVAPGVVPQSTDTIEALFRTIMTRLSEDQRKTLFSAIISSGGLTVQDGGALQVRLASGVETFYTGPMHFQGVEYQGLAMRRSDGTAIFFTFPVDDDPDHIAWVLLDHLGNEVLSSDAQTGGLGRPWIPIYLLPKFAMPAGTFSYYNIAVSAAERQLWEGRIPLVTHSWIEVDGVWGQASGANSTTYRLKVGATEVGAWTVGGGLSQTRRGPYNVSAFLNDAFVPVELTAVSSGTGVMACHVYGAALRQT